MMYAYGLCHGFTIRCLVVEVDVTRHASEILILVQLLRQLPDPTNSFVSASQVQHIYW